MVLSVITDKKAISKALKDFKIIMTKGLQWKKRNVGFRGGSVEAKCYYNSNLNLWYAFEHLRTEGRSWNVFGTNYSDDQHAMLSPRCEINMPYSGINRSVAGVFLKDELGAIYVGHSGKIGGGVKGVGKNAFWKYYRGDREITVLWPDMRKDQVALIGEISDPNLPNLIALFVREVERIKNLINGVATEDKGIDIYHFSFKPEFKGAKKPYKRGGTIRANSYHGIVVNSLADRLKGKGYLVGNDRRDLFIVEKDSISTLFEVKTGSETTDCYMAVGQLMIYSAQEKIKPRLVAVLPGRPDSNTSSIFSLLGVEILSYEFNGKEVDFLNLRKILTS